MAVLASAEDVSTAMGRALTDAEEDRAEGLLVTASAAVEAAMGGRQFVPGDYSGDRVPDSRGRVWISGPATSTVTVVRDVNEATGEESELVEGTDYTVRGRRVYGLRGRCRVVVEFTIGEGAVVPDDVVKVTAGVVAGTLSGPPVGAQSQSAGSFSISYVDASGRVYLTKSDRAVLAKYRDPDPAVRLL